MTSPLHPSPLTERGRGEVFARLRKDNYMDITIYTTPTCSYCRQLKEFLAQKRIPYKEHDVTQDRVAAAEIAGRTGQTGVPVIIIDGQIIIGFDRVRLEQALAQKQRPTFGASIADASKITAKKGLPVTLGVYIGNVRPGSVAEKMGLKPGDIVTELNMRPIGNASHLELALTKLDKGSRILLVFLRGNQTMKTEGII